MFKHFLQGIGHNLDSEMPQGKPVASSSGGNIVKLRANRDLSIL